MSQQVGNLHVDPFAVEQPSDLSDWQVPLSFMKTRHMSTAEDKESRVTCDSSRVKERVRLDYGRVSCGIRLKIVIILHCNE